MAAMDGNHARRLLKIAQQCLEDRPSRTLDGIIYCAVYGLEDLNDLSHPKFEVARATGEVLVGSGRGFAMRWFSAPRYTTEKEAARALFPHHVDILPDNLPFACAAALRVRVAVGAPTPVLPSAIHDKLGE